MTKVYGQLAVLGLMAASLSACQSIDTVRIKHVKETESSKTNALIYCAGTANCEFERLNKIQIIDQQWSYASFLSFLIYSALRREKIKRKFFFPQAPLTDSPFLILPLRKFAISEKILL